LKEALPICHQHRLQVLEIEVLHMMAHLFQKTGKMAELQGCKKRIDRMLELVR
jgi:hypothetical protein